MHLIRTENPNQIKTAFYLNSIEFSLFLFILHKKKLNFYKFRFIFNNFSIKSI